MNWKVDAMRPTILDTPTTRMLTTVRREALSISQMVREAREAGWAGAAIAMHIELDTKLRPGGLSVIIRGVRIACWP